MPRSHRYDSDSDSDQQYIPIIVNAGNRGSSNRGSGRRNSPPEVITNNTFLGIPSAPRRRAASTGGAAQPVNIQVLPAQSEHSHSRSRSHSRHRHHSSSDSDRSRSRHGRRYSSKPYDIDRLPYDLRRDLDFARESRLEERSRSRERRERRAKERWEEEYENRKRKDKEKKDKIIEEAKEAEEKKKLEEEKFKKKVLEDEANKKLKEKAKKEADEAAFEEKVKEKFKAAGWSNERIEEALHHKKRERRREDDREWAIDLSRPTFIKVNRKYLHPDTLDHYSLPWEWDKKNSEYIIIKRYIDHDFQDILFEHTKRLKERKLITSGYTKETITTLKPAGILKDKDEMFLVRTKSKSPARSRRSSWMFT